MNRINIFSTRLLFASFVFSGIFSVVSATPVFVHEELNELDVVVESSLVGLRGMVFIENKEQQVIACQVVFKNGPEIPTTRKERIKPGVKKMVSANMNRVIVRLNIDVTCNKESLQK